MALDGKVLPRFPLRPAAGLITEDGYSRNFVGRFCWANRPPGWSGGPENGLVVLVRRRGGELSAPARPGLFNGREDPGSRSCKLLIPSPFSGPTEQMVEPGGRFALWSYPQDSAKGPNFQQRQPETSGRQRESLTSHLPGYSRTAAACHLRMSEATSTS